MLEGTNKQDSMTVLASLEACIEFSCCQVEYLKRDNAAAHYLKEILIVIPRLNLVRFNIRVIVVVVDDDTNAVFYYSNKIFSSVFSSVAVVNEDL